MLNRKLRRELSESKGLLLTITLIISVGIICFVTMRSSYLNLLTAQDQYYRRSRMADFWLDVKKAPVTEIARISELPGVNEIHTRIRFNATVDLENVDEPLNGIVISMPNQREPVLNDLVLIKGDYFTERRENEVILNDAFARAHKLYPGSKIHLLLNDRRQEFFVVGTAMSSEFTYLLAPGALIPDPKRFGLFYIKRTFAEDAFDFRGAANQVVGTLLPTQRKRPQATLDAMERTLDSYGVLSATPLEFQASNQFLSQEISSLGSFSTIVPSIFLIVAALILNVLLTRLARQQRTVVGTLKALGYSDLRIFWHFLKFGLTVGVVGGLVGGGIGYLLSTGMTSIYRGYFEFPELSSRFYWGTQGLGMAVSIGCSLAGSLYGAYTMLHLRPAEAMRPATPIQGGAIWIERLPFVWKRLDSGWRMALRNVFRNRWRSATGVFAAAMGSGLLVTGFMMNEATTYLLDFQFYQQVRSDYDLSFRSEVSRESLDELRSLPAVTHVEPLFNVAATFEKGSVKRKLAISGISPGAELTVPQTSDGTPIPIPEKGLVLTQRLADILRAKPGDSIEITPVTGNRRTVSLPVVQIADSYMGLSAYASLPYLCAQVGEEFSATGAQLKVDDDPAAVQALYRELKRRPEIQAINARLDMVANLEKAVLEQQTIAIGFLIGFAGIILFGSIVNSSFVSLAERQREVGTFRALGYGVWNIGNIFLRESVIINSIGIILGLPIGYLLTLLTAEAFATDLMRLPVVTAPWIWWTTIFIAAAFTMLAHAVVQRTIVRMDFLEALKVKE
ncbi:MAG: ABC transporter permease [bacterium]|nr:ABC transporter permease [bacterium]